MEDTEKPEWSALGYFFFVALVVALVAFINTYMEHDRPQKKYVERSYRHGGSAKDQKENHKLVEEHDKVVNSHNKKEEPAKVELKSTVSKKDETDSKGDKSDEEYFADLIDNYKSSVLSKLNKPESRSDVVVRYYTKPKDKDRVYSLRKYGFYIHERKTDSVFADFPSNSLYYGDDISNDDIQLIAYTLIQAGVDLKRIVPSKLHDDWKANSVEIGSDSLALKMPSLEISDLRKNWKTK
ncbi:hypothetical protein [Reichenbachiella sp. MALMAid0571]|uniref:hypothetical protein n=1 Tax=Reichenbachiella sp. MALMAid0571 TaxID=3143939 RepID=UPI0032DF9707